MKRLLVILSILFLLPIYGCSASQTASQPSPAAVVKQPTDDSVNGYRISKPTVESSNTSSNTQSHTKNDDLLYYANKNSKTFHLSTCGTAKRIKNENLYITDDRNELLLEDYKPCSNCNP